MAELDPCPHCGRTDFGNAGARAQHIKSCVEGNGQTESVTLETVDETQQEAAPQPQDQGPATAEAGKQIGTGLSVAMDSSAPTQERMAAVQSAANLLSGLINGRMEYEEQRRERAEQRAKNANLVPVDDKPKCGNCGATFAQIPPGAERVQCPECLTEYRVD